MDFETQLQDLLEKKIEGALKNAEAKSKPVLQELLARVRAAETNEEMTRLTQEATDVLGRMDGANTLRGRWNMVKSLFKR
jgi:hypothetical protein